MKTLTKDEALHCAEVFNEYFGQFSRIDEYMRTQKIASIDNIPQALPGMGLETEMFDDFTMSPEVMDLQVVELDNHTWDTCIKTCCKRNEHRQVCRIYEVCLTCYKL